MKSENIVAAVFGTVLKVIGIIAVIFLIYKGADFCYEFGYRIFAEPAVSSGEGRLVTVAVTEDMSPTQIGEAFEQNGLVRDAKLFALQYLFSEYRKDVKPGVFELSTAMTAEEMMEVMAAEPDETKLSVPDKNVQVDENAGDEEPGIEESGTADAAEE